MSSLQRTVLCFADREYIWFKPVETGKVVRVIVPDVSLARGERTGCWLSKVRIPGKKSCVILLETVCGSLVKPIWPFSEVATLEQQQRSSVQAIASSL